MPYGDPKLPHDTLQDAIIIWQPVFNNTLTFQLDMSNITTCIEAKAKFLKSSFEVDQKVIVEIYIRYKADKLTYKYYIIHYDLLQKYLSVPHGVHGFICLCY